MTINVNRFYEDVVSFLENEGYESSFREDYSGRGMYGQTTPAIVSDASGGVVTEAILEVAVEGYDMSFAEAKQLTFKNSDNMGLDMVYYNAS